MIIVWKVPFTLHDEAKSAWRKLHNRTRWTVSDDADFYGLIGVTPKQLLEYKDSWNLRVSRATYQKLEILASGTPHCHTLFKMVDIRHGLSGGLDEG